LPESSVHRNARPAGQYKAAKPVSLDEVITDSGEESATATEVKPDFQSGRNLLGRHAHPWHHQPSGCGDVRRRTALFPLPLPVEAFRYYLERRASVHLDGCVEVEAAYYSAPPGWIGRRSKQSTVAS